MRTIQCDMPRIWKTGDTFDEIYDNKLQNDYYDYKKPSKESEKLDDVFDFE
jgi:hypothetical protein